MTKQFTVQMTCDNDAFQPDPSAEIARALRIIANRIESGDPYGTFRNIQDSNGNIVGVFALKEVQ